MLIGAMLVRNEEVRYLERVLEQMRSVCDKIIVVDDASTDNTPDICRKFGATVFQSDKPHWRENELLVRKWLWGEACDMAQFGDWILCLDADETLCPSGALKMLIKSVEAKAPQADGIGFPLYDMWSPTHYRDDALWNAHTRPWVMTVKYDPGREYVWRETPLHCGRFPINASEIPAYTDSIKIQHWGWSRQEDREAKYKRYMEVDPNGENGSLAQYMSILDDSPSLKEFKS